MNAALPALSVCESPIEKKLIETMFAEWKFVRYCDQLPACVEECGQAMYFNLSDDGYQICVCLQALVKGLPFRRVDLVVEPAFADPFIVEVDGFQWHCSKEGMLGDRRKDRRATALGLLTFRFMGTEVHGKRSAVLKWIHDMCVLLDLQALRKSDNADDRAILFEHGLRAAE